MCLTSEWFDEAENRRKELMRDMRGLGSPQIRQLIKGRYERSARTTVWPIYVEALEVANQVLEGRGHAPIRDVRQRRDAFRQFGTSPTTEA